MACRVGITTNPGERRRYWESKYSTLRNWRIVSRHETKSAAQQKENEIARSRGCDASPGGAGSAYARWCVYVFDHDGR